jgi:integrase
VHKTLRQVLDWAVAADLLDTNVAVKVPNPEPKRREIPAFGSWAEVDLVASKLLRRYRAIPLFVAATGLRCEEWLALERGDIDRAAGLVHVRRVFVDGQVKPYGKQARSLRAVPLPAVAIEALDAMPPRIDTTVLFPGKRAGHLDLHSFRERYWKKALVAAELAHRGPNALRHTFASFAIAVGIDLYPLARLMGTSFEQIDRTYGHLLPDSLDRARDALNSQLGAAVRSQSARKT